jgi:superfamily II DNA or RNA helicase
VNQVNLLNSVKYFFNDQVFNRGKQYQAAGWVKDIEFDAEQHMIKAKTYNGVDQIYQQIINYELSSKFNKVFGQCTCPYDGNCKHVAAVMLEALKKFRFQPKFVKKQPSNSNSQQLTQVQSWLNRLTNLESASAKEPGEAADKSHGIVYLLDYQAVYDETILGVIPQLAKVLKRGGFGQGKRHGFDLRPNEYQYLTEEDGIIFHHLRGLAGELYNPYYDSGIELKGKKGDELLDKMLSTQRCFWQTAKSLPLTRGPTRSAMPCWSLTCQAEQKFSLLGESNQLPLFILENCWYLDLAKAIMGPIATELPAGFCKDLLKAPPIPLQLAKKVNATLQTELKYANLPPLKQLPQEQRIVKPTPCLRLYTQKLNFIPVQRHSWLSEAHLMPLANLTFRYGDVSLPYYHNLAQAYQLTQDHITEIPTDIAAEQTAINTLIQYNYQPLTWCDNLHPANAKFESKDFYLPKDQDPYVLHQTMVLQLKALGWQITYAEDYPYRVIEQNVDEWYSEITTGENWFDLELGIIVNGQRVNLLPVLQKALQQLDDSQHSLLTLEDEQIFYAELPGGNLLPIPGRRLKKIVNTLVELFDHKSLTAEDRLRLSLIEASRLEELEKATEAAKLNWFGASKLKALALQFKQFEYIKPVKPPKWFSAELRPYQQIGLNWLQFLREYKLGGILADDMGLGKTIQTLAHLSVEKASNRLAKPALIVAPTSLIYNWEQEARRFACELEILVLHGLHRKSLLDTVQPVDLIITTYTLLLQDKELHLGQHYSYFILDEAQFIKNPRTKMALSAMQIKADHRLCLTGTPMENHLGELWSLFHFLMPGLLGDAEGFKRLYRTPIEKHGDKERRNQLLRRIKPVILRRTKDQVATELPAKTQIIRLIELDEVQRDIYETIRNAMHDKVTAEIAKKGLARSQIMLLDALLKLRQVCCDPRLVKLSSTKHLKREYSAKLNTLLNLLQDLLAEGRRILLFSQFTSMFKLIEAELEQLHIPYVKLTGETQNRQALIERFQSGEVNLFLISLKAGGTGLNLTRADTVIHYDPWWNPAVENQATDRAHRLGQINKVFVYKLVMKDTIEEKIIKLQEKKQALLNNLLESTQDVDKKLSHEELLALI